MVYLEQPISHAAGLGEAKRLKDVLSLTGPVVGKNIPTNIPIGISELLIYGICR